MNNIAIKAFIKIQVGSMNNIEIKAFIIIDKLTKHSQFHSIKLSQHAGI
jgi:hypothetical protein